MEMSARSLAGGSAAQSRRAPAFCLIWPGRSRIAGQSQFGRRTAKALTIFGPGGSALATVRAAGADALASAAAGAGGTDRPLSAWTAEPATHPVRKMAARPSGETERR
jgi:hypothetical protein